jgi:hypothetical protein
MGECKYRSTNNPSTALDGSEWSDSRFGRFTTGEIVPAHTGEENFSKVPSSQHSTAHPFQITLFDYPIMSGEDYK